MPDDDTSELAAGDFSSWLDDVQRAIRGEGASDVPCNGCTACCRSSQFVTIAPDELDTLARIPPELLFPAPRRPRGHVVLGYDERGHCPMLVDDRCSIYAHRPRTCRAYDCRVFPAAGLAPDGDEKASIERRTRRWKFSFPTGADRERYEAVRAAARYVGEHPDRLPPGTVPTNTTHHAVVAIELHGAFLDRGDDGPDPDAIRVVLRRRLDASP